MCLIPRRNSLVALLLASLCFPFLPSQAQDQAPVARSQHGWLDPTVKEEYKKWLNEDVRWIITDDERADFKRLLSDKKRDEFVVAFWDRRNPSPGAARNAYKEEHYRRLAYANTHFAANVPGWKTERGTFYVMYGPPDSVDAKSGFVPPTETWHYQFVEGIGRNVILRFTDKCVCGRYELSGADSDSRPHESDAPLRH
jgi:GWxTD domain-containing protein